MNTSLAAVSEAIYRSINNGMPLIFLISIVNLSANISKTNILCVLFAGNSILYFHPCCLKYLFNQ